MGTLTSSSCSVVVAACVSQLAPNCNSCKVTTHLQLITQARSMAESSHPRCIRGPYRSKQRTPRQTKHNRKRKQTIDEGSVSTDVQFHNEEPRGDSLSSQQPVPTSSSTTMGVAHPSQVQQASAPPMTVTAPSLQLFPNAVVTQLSSEVSINTFISRHHLTRQAQEDLLHLLQLHMPS